MDFLKYSEKLGSLEYFVKNSSAVTAGDLSKRLGVSKQTVFRMVDILRLKGAGITYCKARIKYML